MDREEFVKLYKEYAKTEQNVCNFYRKVIGSCENCPLQNLACGTFDFDRAPIENLIEILDKWRKKNEANN